MSSDDISSVKEKLKNFKRESGGKNADSAPSLDDMHESSTESSRESMNMGMRAGSELIVGVIAGALIGYGLDRFFETKPIFFLLFIILGVGVGFLNIYKLSQNIGTSVGFAELHKRKKAQNSQSDKNEETKLR